MVRDQYFLELLVDEDRSKQIMYVYHEDMKDSQEDGAYVRRIYTWSFLPSTRKH